MKKLILAICLLFLTIGLVNAVDINDYKLPSDFKVESEYWASNGDFGLSIG